MTERTSLVTSPDSPIRYNNRRFGDALHVLIIGLAEYLEDQSGVDGDGVETKFRAITPWHATPEDDAVLPAAAILAPAEVPVESSLGRPMVKLDDRVGAPDRQWIQPVGELTTTLELTITAEDPYQRAALLGLVEDAMCPVDWMAGVRLRLPHYYGAHAEYVVTSIRASDTPFEAQTRRRTAVVMVAARVPWLRLMGVRRPARISATVEATG